MASPPPLPASGRIPGLSFAPEHAELITRYLGPKIAGLPLPAETSEFIHEADVYAADPATLCANFPPASSGIEESRYFFSYPKAKNSRGSRKSRTVGEGKGTWHAESRKAVVDGEGRLVGYRRSFCHETSSGEKSGWLMMEYAYGANQEDGGPVVCKIYKTPRPRTDGCSARKKGNKGKDPAAPSARGKKRKAEDQGRSDSAAPAARVRRRLNFRPPPAVLEDGLLKESQRQHSEADEQPTPAFDPISFLADGRALPALNCVLGDWQIAPEDSGSWNTATPEFFHSSPMPLETHPEESTPAGDCSVFLNDHAGFGMSCPDMPPGAYWASPAVAKKYGQYGETSAVDCSFFLRDHAGFAPSCHDTTHMSPDPDLASTAASEQYGQSCFGSCTNKMEFLASLPVTGFEHNAPIYWPAEPSFAPTASSAASTPLCSSRAEWASPMILPLQGLASGCFGVCSF